MPSTYTTNLGIEKIGTGEQSGTWGDTTNTNFDLIDQAVNGITSFTVTKTSTGDPTLLQIVDGAISGGRNAFIEFTSASDLGAAGVVQLTPNDAEKIVHVRNSLQGSQSLILFQGAYNASNDYVVPNGADVLLKFSGTGSGSTVTAVQLSPKFDGTMRVEDVVVSGTLDATGATVDVSGGTLTLANNQISGNKVDGGTISNFASTGIDDNASALALILSRGEQRLLSDNFANHVVTFAGYDDTNATLLGQLKFGGATGEYAGIYVPTDQYFRISNEPGDTRYTLTVDLTNHRIGIFTDAPTEALDIAGNIALTGTVDGRDVAADGSKLDGIAPSANNYVHPNDGGGNRAALTGATVYSDITINSLGHVTATAVRNMTLADLGYTGATDANNYSLPKATATVRGGVELGSNTVQTVAANSPSTSAGKTYPVQLNSADQMVVNVPWADTTNPGTVTSVDSGTGLTGGPITTSGTLALATAGAGAGTYGSTADGTKIDQITLDAYGRVTGITTGATGDITGVTAGVGLSGGGSSGSVTLTLDMSELTDMTAAMVGTDEFIVLDAGADRRKAANEIGLSIFNNDSGFTTNVGDITNVGAGNGLTGGGASGSVTLNVGAGSLIDVGADTVSVDLSELTDMTATMVSTDEFVVLDASAQRRKAASEIGLSIFNNDAGFVTTDNNTTYALTCAQSSGTNANPFLFLNGSSGTDYNVQINGGVGIDVNRTSDTSLNIIVDLSELTDMTAAMVGTDEFIVLDAGADRRKAANEIGLSIFNNDAGFTTNTGDITGVTAGTGLTGGGTSGSVTLNVAAGVGLHVNANDVALYSTFAAGGTQTIQDEEFIVVTSAGQTITLPASPSQGDTVYISVGNFTNTVVNGNGRDIMADPSNLTIDVANIGITLVYYDATQGWRLM